MSKNSISVPYSSVGLRSWWPRRVDSIPERFSPSLVHYGPAGDGHILRREEQSLERLISLTSQTPQRHWNHTDKPNTNYIDCLQTVQTSVCHILRLCISLFNKWPLFCCFIMYCICFKTQQKSPSAARAPEREACHWNDAEIPI